jgi:hypothetical protein
MPEWEALRTHACSALASVSARLNTRGTLMELDRYLRRTDREARAHVRKLIPQHSLLLELACTMMVLLTRYVIKGPGNRQRGAYAALQNRATNDLLCSRHLLETGFEQSAGATTRSYLETLDLALACIGDAGFAEAYSADDADTDSFWREQVGYGRIYTHVAKAMRLAELDADLVEEKIARRRSQKTVLSRTVHADFGSAFRSWAPPPLGYPGMVSTAPHGVANTNTANHSALLIVETYEYCSTVMKIMTAGAANEVLDRPKGKRQLQKYAMHFFTFQDLLHEWELRDGREILAPDHVTPSEEETS